MSIDEAAARVYKGNKTLFKRDENNEIQKWYFYTSLCGESGYPEVCTECVMTDDKTQKTFEPIKEGVNIGKPNEINVWEYACYLTYRRIKENLDNGYKETIEEL